MHRTHKICYAAIIAAMVMIMNSSVLLADLFVRVVDTGSGQCCVVRTHNDKFIVYDLGHWAGDGYRAYKGLEDVIPAGFPIDLLVLSHSDSDHNGGGKRVFDHFEVKKVVRTGYVRDTETWERIDKAIADESGCVDINLATDDLPEDIQFGETNVSFLCGWHEPPANWGLSGGEFRNAGSICIRIEFAEKAVIFCGDAVGRHLDSSTNTCIATERYMCDNANEKPIAADVIIAGHHGANNASSERFIQEVNPNWVIFSAGHAHQHPTYSAAKRFLDHGVPLENFFRTDLGDHEPGPYEWWYGRKPDQVDPIGDDDIDIRIKPSGFVKVEYRYENNDLSFEVASEAPWNSDVPQEVLEDEAIPREELRLRDNKGKVIPDEHDHEESKPDNTMQPFVHAGNGVPAGQVVMGVRSVPVENSAMLSHQVEAVATVGVQPCVYLNTMPAYCPTICCPTVSARRGGLFPRIRSVLFSRRR